jgi:hypothetical protein
MGYNGECWLLGWRLSSCTLPGDRHLDLTNEEEDFPYIERKAPEWRQGCRSSAWVAGNLRRQIRSCKELAALRDYSGRPTQSALSPEYPFYQCIYGSYTHDLGPRPAVRASHRLSVADLKDWLLSDDPSFPVFSTGSYLAFDPTFSVYRHPRSLSRNFLRLICIVSFLGI